MIDKIFSWHGWTVVKWPFGFLLCFLILLQIWYLNTRVDYEKNLRIFLSEACMQATNIDEVRRLVKRLELDEAGPAIKNTK